MAAAYLTLIAVFLAAVCRWNVAVKSPWALGDWLINYQGGFVRRGLPGEVAFRLGSLLHVSPVSWIAAMQLVCYAVLLGTVWLLFRESSGRYWMQLLLFSPATLAFPVLDLLGGFRKEVIYLAGLAGLLWLLRRHAEARVLTSYCAVMMVVLPLSHEALIFFTAYWFAALSAGLKSSRAALRILLPAIALGLVCCAAALTHRGDERLEGRVCKSLRDPAFCTGAVAALGQTPSQARGEVSQMISTFHPLGDFALAGLLAIVPVGGAAWDIAADAGRTRAVWRIAGAGGVSLALTGWLFVYSMDWGRWVSLHVFSLFLLLLFVDRRGAGVEEPRRGRSWAAYGLLAVYAMTWSLPRMPRKELQSGYAGLVRMCLSRVGGIS